MRVDEKPYKIEKRLKKIQEKKNAKRKKRVEERYLIKRSECSK
jgi:hypothetical protein